jgi:uncharacterized protein (TIGR01244 family)
MKTATLTDRVMVAPQIAAEDFAALAAAGVRAVINNRPDGEDPGQLSSEETARLAAASGLAYRHIPVTAATLSDEAVATFRQEVAAAGGKVLAYCRSGTRSATLWALGEILAGELSRDEALAIGRANGLDLSGGLAWLDRRGQPGR